MGFTEGFTKHQSPELEPKLSPQKLGGVYSGGATPDPIPNSEVKPAHGEHSTGVVRR